MKYNYDVKITKQAKEQMAQIVDYISDELFAPETAINLLDKYSGEKSPCDSCNIYKKRSVKTIETNEYG